MAASPRAVSARGPALALAAIVGLAFVAYTVLALAVDVPRVHPDEVRYLIGASSLVEGEGLTLRGAEYGFGPLYALVLAPILLLTSPDAGYDFFKAANALLFALTAVPVFLLARRIVAAWWAVVAAGLAVAIPSSISVATVMTESLAYFTSAWAILAIAHALEKPSLGRQLAVLVTVALAFLTRSQLGALYLTWILALVVVWWISPSRRPRTRAELVSLWPSTLPAILAGLVVIGRVLTGSSPSESLGAYWELWRGYDLFGIVKWFVYHLADLEIYLAVVPLAVLPIVLGRLIREGRAGSAVAGGFVALFVAANAAGLFVVAAFNSTEYAYDRLHDRYAFYLVPLWLIVLVKWLADGMPRPLLATATGVAFALALPAILPFRQLANEAGIDTVPGALWLWIESKLSGPGPISGRIALALFVLALVAAAVFLPRRFRLALPAAVLAGFVAMAVPAWERILDAPEDAVFAGGLERGWIDSRLPDDARVTKLYIESARCGTSTVTRHALFLTEFFNETVDRAAYIGDSTPDGIPLPRVELEDGRFVLESGQPLLADYVYTQPGLELDGRRLATGTAAGLVLWETGGAVRAIGARTTDDVRTDDCPAA